MTDNLRESMSALMDDEANELEVRRILNEMNNNKDIRATWARYQLVSGAMKKRLDSRYQLDISERVSAALIDEKIEVEAGHAVAGASPRSKPLISFAVAASVAFAVVFGAFQFNQQDNSLEPGFAERSVPQGNSIAVGPETPELGTLVSAEAQELTPSQERLRASIDNHEQQADLARGRGVMPYAQLVSDEKQD